MILFAINTFMVAILQTPLIDKLSNYNKILFTGIGGLLVGIGLMLLNFSSLFIIAIISCLIWTIGEMLFFSMARLVCYESFNSTKKGRALGLYQMAYAASMIIGPFLGGIVYHHVGSNVMWYICAAIGILIFLVCSVFPGQTKYIVILMTVNNLIIASFLIFLYVAIVLKKIAF